VLAATPPATDPLKTKVTKIKVHMSPLQCFGCTLRKFGRQPHQQPARTVAPRSQLHRRAPIHSTEARRRDPDEDGANASPHERPLAEASY
jgi:hypothetical protein